MTRDGWRWGEQLGVDRTAHILALSSSEVVGAAQCMGSSTCEAPLAVGSEKSEIGYCSTMGIKDHRRANPEPQWDITY